MFLFFQMCWNGQALFTLGLLFELKPIWQFIIFFQLGGGYLFGLPVGFFADSIGATLGAGAAFLLGRTVSFFYSTRVILF